MANDLKQTLTYLELRISPFAPDRKQVARWEQATNEAAGQKEKGGGGRQEYSILEDSDLGPEVLSWRLM